MEYITQFSEWLKNILLWIPEKLWALILDGAATVIEAIPVPQFVADASTNLGMVSAEIYWWIAPFYPGFGITVMSAALLARFILRRVPVIG